MSSSDSDDSVLNFNYIPKSERERQKQDKALDSDAVDREETHVKSRKRSRTIYEQERDAKITEALQSSGAGEILAQVQRVTNQEKAEKERATRYAKQALEQMEAPQHGYYRQRGYYGNERGRGGRGMMPYTPRQHGTTNLPRHAQHGQSQGEGPHMNGYGHGRGGGGYQRRAHDERGRGFDRRGGRDGNGLYMPRSDASQHRRYPDQHDGRHAPNGAGQHPRGGYRGGEGPPQ